VWISESADHYKPELAQLLYPLFTHLYIRLLHCQAPLRSISVFAKISESALRTITIIIEIPVNEHANFSFLFKCNTKINLPAPIVAYINDMDLSGCTSRSPQIS
jgi:hypothetical protein